MSTIPEVKKDCDCKAVTVTMTYPTDELDYEYNEFVGGYLNFRQFPVLTVYYEDGEQYIVDPQEYYNKGFTDGKLQERKVIGRKLGIIE